MRLRGPDTPAITALNPAVITLGLVPQPVQFSIDSSDECGIAGWSIDTPGKVLFFVYKEIPEDTIYPPANKNAGPTRSMSGPSTRPITNRSAG